MHIDALYHPRRPRRMLRVNEPMGKTAPRFSLAHHAGKRVAVP